MRVARILFARLPEYGRVKSRLAADLDAEAAFALYKWLLRIQNRIFQNLPDRKNKFTNLVFFTPDASRIKARIAFFPDLAGFSLRFRAQCGGDLGTRLAHAASYALKKHDLALIWGADIPCLPRSVESQAIALAPQSVITLAKDGGYAFLSVSRERYTPGIFEGIRWSTPAAGRDQIRALKKAGVGVVVAGKVTDLDRAKDFTRMLRELEQSDRTRDLEDLRRTLTERQWPKPL